jgi:hypothetical protein
MAREPVMHQHSSWITQRELVNMSNKILDVVFNQQGFYEGLHLSESDLQILSEMITESYLSRIEKVIPDHIDEFRGRSIEHYHELSHYLDHEDVWTTNTRNLSHAEVDRVQEMRLFDTLRENFGDISLTDQMNMGWPEMNWRLVRPGEPNDFGPIHSDRWYWDITEGKIPDDKERLNIWIAIYTEPGKCGLRVVPNSQNQELAEYATTRDDKGYLRPVMQAREEDLDIQVLKCPPGNMLVFHDDILHGGSYNYGSTCRVSLEFTLLIEKQNAP